MALLTSDTPLRLERPPLARALALARGRLPLPLLVLLLLQAGASLTLRNTAFQDEGIYLYAGREILRQWLGGAPAGDPYSEYFSGLPYLYPVLAGALDIAGGLELARLLSLACMLWTVVAVYLLARRLLSESSALPAAALFAVQGSVLFLGRLATYDALSLALLAGAAVLALRAGEARGGVASLGTGVDVGAALCLAVAAKYAALLYAPTVLAILAWQARHHRGWRAALLRPALAGAVMMAGLVAVVAADESVLVGLRDTTTERVAYLYTTALTLATRSAALTWSVLAFGALGVLLLDRRRRPLALLLLGTALLAPLYHILKAEPTSLHKHVAFGTLFAAPVAGYAVARLAGLGAARTAGPRWLAGLALCLLVFDVGLRQARSMYAEWPDSRQLDRVLRTMVRPGSGRILAEESEVTRYYLQDVVHFWQWNQLYWFYYTDAQGRALTGVPAYQAAIAEGYFDVVVLRYGPSASVAYAIDSGLKDGVRYELVTSLPFETTFGEGAFRIWRKRPA